MTSDEGMRHLQELDVSRETNLRLAALVALLTKWNSTINLVSKESVGQIWTRHILDSAQIFRLGSKASLWADLGSGGGFPGLVVAVLAAEKAPSMQLVLVESDQRKASFLRQAGQALGLSVGVVAERIENIEPLNADIISARALAPLPQLCGFAGRHLAQDGSAIFLKGRSHADELAKAREGWNFSLESHASITDPSAIVLVLKGIVHV